MKILLIEDEVKTARTIKAWLEDVNYEVDCIFDGKAGLELSLQNRHDLIISDVILPTISGLQICKELRQKGVNTPIIILSALNNSDDKVNGLDAGADDYLAKPFDFPELLARINALQRRFQKNQFPANKLVFEDIELNLDTYEVHRSGKKVVLTIKEFALLEFMVRNNGRVLTKAEILKNVWGVDVDINTNVIEVYVNYLRNKIEKGFETKLIHTQFGVGYIMKSQI